MYTGSYVYLEEYRLAERENLRRHADVVMDDILGEGEERLNVRKFFRKNK